MQLWQLTMPGVADEEERADMSGKGREQLQSKSFPDTSNKTLGKEKKRTPWKWKRIKGLAFPKTWVPPEPPEPPLDPPEPFPDPSEAEVHVNGREVKLSQVKLTSTYVSL